MIPKQDRSPIRQAREIEQKYNLNTDFTAVKKIAADAQKAVERANNIIDGISTDIAALSADVADILVRLAALEAGGGGSILPDGYTILEYIESSGTQYIDTGFKPNNNTKVVMTAALSSTPSGDQALFGVRESNTNQLWWYWRGSSSRFAFRYGNSSTNNLVSGSATAVNVFEANKSAFTVSGESVTATEVTFQSNYPALLFAVNNAGAIQYPSSCKVYSCRIYDNDVLVRDFVPCKNASGETGLYDKANGQFYGNAGSGVFTGA